MKKLEVDKLIGQQVSALRAEAGRTVEVAAAALDLDSSRYLAAEAGERRFKAEELFKLARLFNCLFSYIFKLVRFPDV